MNPFADLLRNLGPVRVAALAATGLAVLGFFIFLTTRMTGGGNGLLYSNLESQESNQIITQLEIKGIEYKIKDGGKQIFVPSDKVRQLRMEMAEQGLPSGGSMGYEIFDKSQGLGTTSFVQNVNLVRALEGELGRTIGSMKQVRGSRVHLVLPQRELFSRERRKPSASVVLQMRGSGRLGKENVLAIQHLVAAAVPEMGPENVAVMDDRGNLLARGQGEEESATQAASNAEEMRTTLESKLARSIEQLIERTVGLGRVRAEVSAEVDYDRITENREEYDPEGQVVRSTNTVEERESSTESDKAEGVSVATNLPEENSGDRSGTSAQSQARRTEETVNFEITRTVRNRVKESGAVRRLSVAVLVDGRYSVNEEDERVYNPRPTDELEQIERLVKSTVGFDQKRGDTVEVVNMQFVKLKPLDFDDGSSFLGISKDELLDLAEVLVLAVVGLLVVLLVVRPILTRLFESMPSTAAAGTVDTQNALAQLTGPDGMELTEMLEAEEEGDGLLDQMIDINQVEGRVRASSLKKIGEIVDKHPEEAVAIIRNWMYQEGTG